MTLMTTLSITAAVENDTAEANAYVARNTQRLAVESAMDSIRRYVGQDRRNGSWTGNAAEALAAPAAAQAHYQTQWETAHARRAAAADAVAQWDAVIEAHEQVWVEGGRWSRFFLVTSSDGHIHSSMGCPTCNFRTEFAWLPELSGLTPADAVESLGEILCSHCFPDAPTSWTSGTSKASKAEKAERAAKKSAAAAAKLAKCLLPDGSPLRFNVDGWSERIETIAAAKIWLTDSFDYTPSDSKVAGRTLVAEALAARTGETVEAVLEAARIRQARR